MEFSRPEYWSGSLALLQGIFPTQGLNPGLPHCRQLLYQLSHRQAQEHWGAWSIPSPGGLPDPGIEPVSVALQADSLPAELSGKPYLHSYVGQISKRRCYLIKNLGVKGFALKISCIWGKTSLSEKNKKQKTGSMFLRWKGKE